jgi:WD40 repeat protein
VYGEKINAPGTIEGWDKDADADAAAEIADGTLGLQFYGFDLSAQLDSKYIGTWTGAARSILWRPDGLVYYVMENTDAQVQEYTLNDLALVAWTPSDAGSGVNSLSFSGDDATMHCIRWGNDGNTLITAGSTTVYKYDLSTPWDIDTAVITGDTFNVSAKTTDMGSINFTSDGLNAYICDEIDLGGNKMHQYTLSTAWDITTMTFAGSIATGIPVGGAIDMMVNDQGNMIWLLNDNGRTIHEYQMTTPNDITTAVANSETYLTNPPESSPKCIGYSDDDTGFFYYAGTATNVIRQFQMSSRDTQPPYMKVPEGTFNQGL